MNCAQAKSLCSAMLDAMLEPAERYLLQQHLGVCATCSSYFAALRRNRWLLATTAPHPAPPELAPQMRSAIAEQIARRQAPPESWLRRWEKALNTIMFPAAAGLCSALIIFGLLIGLLVPVRMIPTNDVPTALYTPPVMTAAPFGLSGGADGEAVMVEAIIDPLGRVQDYHVLHGQSLSPEMKNALIFTQFRPATSFGRPTSGRVVLSFSNIEVGG